MEYLVWYPAFDCHRTLDITSWSHLEFRLLSRVPVGALGQLERKGVQEAMLELEIWGRRLVVQDQGLLCGTWMWVFTFPIVLLFERWCILLHSEESSTDSEVRNAESKSSRNQGLRLEQSKGQEYKTLQKKLKQERLFYWFWELMLHKYIKSYKVNEDINNSSLLLQNLEGM